MVSQNVNVFSGKSAGTAKPRAWAKTITSHIASAIRPRVSACVAQVRSGRRVSEQIAEPDAIWVSFVQTSNWLFALSVT